MIGGGRSGGKTRPRFGTHYYIGAHRYVYYLNRKPQYYFSDRPYTLEDAKSWKSHNQISYGILSFLTASILTTKAPDLSSPEMILASVALLCITGFSIFKFVRALKIHPEKDPMLHSFQCTSDFEKPREDTCEYCGGLYSSGAHKVCPHCNAPVKEPPPA